MYVLKSIKLKIITHNYKWEKHAFNSYFSGLDDHSRVILKTPSSDEGGYINANYIEASIL